MACLPGPKKPKDLDSFLTPIIEELNDLSKHGLVIRSADQDTCKAKVHLITASGDIPGVADMIHHKGHTSEFGCRICKVQGRGADNQRNGLYFVDINAALRTKAQFQKGDPVSYINCYSKNPVSYLFFPRIMVSSIPVFLLIYVPSLAHLFLDSTECT